MVKNIFKLKKYFNTCSEALFQVSIFKRFLSFYVFDFAAFHFNFLTLIFSAILNAIQSLYYTV